MQLFNQFKKPFTIILILFLIGGCSIQKRISRKYTGERWDIVVLDRGKPTRTVELDSGRKMHVYEKIEELKEAQINTGAFRYDPVVSPAVTKKEFYYFYISETGIVERVEYEIIYE